VTAAHTTTYRYNKSNEMDKMTEPVKLLSARTNLFAYNKLGQRSDTWYNTSGGGTYTGNVFNAPTGFAAHIAQSYDKAGKLTNIKTTRASSDADANRLSDLTYTYTVPDPSACPGAELGMKTENRQTVKDNLTGKTTTYCYAAMGQLTKASTDNGGPVFDTGGTTTPTGSATKQVLTSSTTPTSWSPERPLSMTRMVTRRRHPRSRQSATTASTRPNRSPRRVRRLSLWTTPEAGKLSAPRPAGPPPAMGCSG
jgi:hypothetical protein